MDQSFQKKILFNFEKNFTVQDFISIFVLAKTSDRSPQKLFNLIIGNNIYRVYVSQN